ncbi:low-specificity L-threonine aldolase [Trifolium repens]|nr:low-specificity L-threonine aldolase [Trifolium repens]WJX70833.1 low-specificity L-threonine aldolase [Trifolium repens]
MELSIARRGYAYAIPSSLHVVHNILFIDFMIHVQQACGLNEIKGLRVNISYVETNIIYIEILDNPPHFGRHFLLCVFCFSEEN